MRTSSAETSPTGLRYGACMLQRTRCLFSGLPFVVGLALLRLLAEHRGLIRAGNVLKAKPFVGQVSGRSLAWGFCDGQPVTWICLYWCSLICLSLCCGLAAESGPQVTADRESPIPMGWCAPGFASRLPTVFFEEYPRSYFRISLPFFFWYSAFIHLIPTFVS